MPGAHAWMNMPITKGSVINSAMCDVELVSAIRRRTIAGQKRKQPKATKRAPNRSVMKPVKPSAMFIKGMLPLAEEWFEVGWNRHREESYTHSQCRPAVS